ncbi:hypothetical protein LCGC14_2193940, partial [marine sediment metagenome]
LVGGPASHMVFRGNMGQMHGRQGTIVIESAAAEARDTLTKVPSGRQEPLGSAEVPAPLEARSEGQPLAAAPSVSIPAFASYHPSFYIRQHSFKKRAEIEGQVMDVLARVVEVIKGKAPELELPEPEYVEEVTIT